MKIAHLIAQFYPYIGGAEICVHNVCRTLSDNGHSATVICTTPPAAEKPDLNYEIVHLFPRTCGLLGKMPFIGKQYLEYKLSSLQRKHGFDLWQVTMGYPLAIYAVDFFKRNKIPCVLRCCGEDIQKYPEIGYGYRLDGKIDSLVRKQYPLFDGFVALTQSVKEEYIKLDISEKKIHIIPNGVNTAKFAEIKAGIDKSAIKRKFGFDDDKKMLILTVGRYHPKKGFDSIPAIAQILKGKGLAFQWIVAGKDTPEILRKFPESRGEITSVETFAKSGGEIFSLPSKDLIELYCAADIFVLPTLIETFGMVLVEAMAAGLPIITTDAPGVRDVISDNVNGLKAPAGNPEAIADMVLSLVKDPGLSGSLSGNSIRQAKDFYDWKSVTGKYMLLYEEILKAAS